MPDERDHLAECLRLIRQRARRLQALLRGSNDEMEGAAMAIETLAQEAALHNQELRARLAPLQHTTTEGASDDGRHQHRPAG